MLLLISISAALSLVSIGGGFYEFLVIDPFWPRRPDLIQPQRGGVSRKRFWIPAHSAFELSLIASLIVTWSHLPAVRTTLLVALASHAFMRIWSAIDFIPKALRFERAESIAEIDARKWVRRSLLRLPLDLVTTSAMLMSLINVARETV